MIKFTAITGDDKRLVGLGLSHGNLDRLRDKKPIKIDGESIGIEGLEILIFSGKTEESMAKELNQFITAETVVSNATSSKDD